MEIGMGQMGSYGVGNGSSFAGAALPEPEEADTEVRRGPWTVEEDLLLVNYISVHGEGRWNSLARSAGLKRSGKSCRLRWLNYLRPDVRRGNITAEEQLLILELHSRWGNRWSKIAQHLPGRTDNEIKNYWRTRVQKHAKQLNCDVNSQQFKDAMRHLWMPRLMERIHQAASTDATTAAYLASASTVAYHAAAASATAADPYAAQATTAADSMQEATAGTAQVSTSPDQSTMAGSSSESSAGSWFSSPPVSNPADSNDYGGEFPTKQIVSSHGGCWESLLTPCGYLNHGFLDFEQCGWGAAGGLSSENLWAADDSWLL